MGGELHAGLHPPLSHTSKPVEAGEFLATASAVSHKRTQLRFPAAIKVARHGQKLSQIHCSPVPPFLETADRKSSNACLNNWSPVAECGSVFNRSPSAGKGLAARSTSLELLDYFLVAPGHTGPESAVAKPLSAAVCGLEPALRVCVQCRGLHGLRWSDAQGSVTRVRCMCRALQHSLKRSWCGLQVANLLH